MGTFAVIGKSGQLAKALKLQGAKLGHAVTCYGREELELSESCEVIESFVDQLHDDVEAVILAAAYTDVDKAEIEYELVSAINTIAPTAIATACRKRNLPFVFISTDYVFDGTNTKPYQTTDTTAPINAYGRSKLAGEEGIIESGCKCAILRTSWIFDGLGKNFMTTMLKIAKTRSELRVVDDQIGRPTYAGHLADAVLAAAQKLVNDNAVEEVIYHVSGAGEKTSWAGFANEIFKLCQPILTHEVSVIPVSTDEYPTKAKRPANSVLDTSRFEIKFDHKIPDWKDGVQSAYQEFSNLIREDQHG